MITDTLLNEIQKCKKCTSKPDYIKFGIQTHGNLNSSIMLVSEAPGKTSVTQNKYWMGKGGQIIRKVLKEFGRDLEDICYLSDIVKCWPNDNGINRKPSKNEINNCSFYLDKEISELKPKYILAFGQNVLEYLLGYKINMGEAHNREFMVNGIKVIALYHPSGANRFIDMKEYGNQLRSIIARII